MGRLVVGALLAACGGGVACGGVIGADPIESCLGGVRVGQPLTCAVVAPGTDPDYADAVYRWVYEQSFPNGGPDYNLNNRWSQTASAPAGTGLAGDPVTLTYSYPSDGLGPISNVNGNPAGNNVLNQKLVDWFGSVTAGKAKFREVFDRWEQLSGLRYVETSDDDAPWGTDGVLGVRGDVRIASISIDGGGGVLAFNSFPNVGDMVVDSQDNFANGSNNFRFFRNTVSHEAGHGIGILHVCPVNGTKLMEPFLQTGFDGPQLDDARAAQRNYGDTLENNDVSGAANNLGVLSGTRTFNSLSLDSAGDVDWVRFTASSGGELTVTVTPRGGTYLTGVQLGSACDPGFQITGDVQDLSLDLIAADGTTVVESSNAGSYGVAEQIQRTIATNGSYFLRIRSLSERPANNGNNVQIYDFSVTYTPGGCPGDANGDNQVNFTDLNFVLANFGVTGPFVIGDVNQDGVVSFLDLNIVLSYFGRVC
ncbi:MAG: matrixin family metalloprotease [Phycisphaerales bacterium]